MKKTKKVIKARIILNRRIAIDHYVIELDAPWFAANSSPGQFVSVKVQENVSDPLLRIPLGVHAVRGRRVQLLYKVVGDGTRLLSGKRRGEVLSILGPLGNGFDLTRLFQKKDSRAVIVAGGHGIAPLYGLAEAIAKKKRRIDFFTGACGKEHIVCAGKLKKLGAKIYIATEDGSRGCKGYVTGPLIEHLRRNKQYASRTTIFACGPRPMVAAVAKEAGKFKIPAQVSLDAYMACGIGACLGCSIETIEGYKLVCKDGPVFDAREIKWEKAC